MSKIIKIIVLVFIMIVLVVYLLFLPIEISRKKPAKITPIRIY
jgi:uncharacterized protein YqfA (UPF0365 family)